MVIIGEKYMRIYMDNCCFNRPFDDQSQLKIKLEAESKIYIQENIILKKLELVWSYILDYENTANPFDERKNSIQLWKNHAIDDIVENIKIINKAETIKLKGIKSKDALHIACAIFSKSDYFITTDDSILKKLKDFDEINIIDPINFIRSIEL